MTLKQKFLLKVINEIYLIKQHVDIPLGWMQYNRKY